MNILIAAATEREIAPLLRALTIERDMGGRLKCGKYKGHNVDVLVTGAGMVATAFYLGKMLNDHYDAALNFGLAGSFNRDLPVGSMVNIVQDHFAELGAEDGEKFISLEEMKLEGESEVINDSKMKNSVLELIPMVCGITVNTVHGEEKSIEKVFSRFHPNTESMEGAAFLYACMHEGIPCAQVRCISNIVERRNKEHWNIPLAIQNLNRKAIEILDAF